MDKDDGFLDKAIEGLVLFAFNQGEVCTCPSRALIQESIYDKFMERCLARVKAIKQGNPLDTDTMLGAQASKEQLTKILTYLDLGKQEGAQVLSGGAQANMGGDLAGPHDQTTALAWITAGATASHGTVSEPCSHLQKFPHPGWLIGHYAQGATAIEAYWKSVLWPQQSLFIGEPLAAPFAPAKPRAAAPPSAAH